MSADGRPSIALLAHRFGSGTATGIGRYYVELASSLIATDHAHRYVVASPQEGADTWSPPGAERRTIRGPRKALALAWAIAGRPRLDRALGQPDLVHTLHPWTATPTRAPLVATIHDLMPVLHPDWFPRRETWLFGRGLAHVRDHAAAIVADSQATAVDLADRAGIDASRVRVVHLAVDDRFRTRPTAAAVDEVCARHGVAPGRYLLAVGQITRRKNLEVVVRAVAQLDPSLLGSTALLAVGPPGIGADEVESLIDVLGVRERVRLGGYIPTDDLVPLLAGAVALVHPSLDEGFGFTPIEAMAAGVPTIVSRSGSLPEVVGDAAVIVAPDDAGAWAAAIERIVTDDEHRRDLIARGDRHQERYRWSRVASDMVAVYDDVITAGAT